MRLPMAEDEVERLKVEVFDQVTSLAAYLCGTPISVIGFIDGTRQWSATFSRQRQMNRAKKSGPKPPAMLGHEVHLTHSSVSRTVCHAGVKQDMLSRPRGACNGRELHHCER